MLFEISAFIYTFMLSQIVTRVVKMADLIVRNVPDAVNRALRVRAAHHGRSAEAEVRAILEDALRSDDRVKLGSLLADIGRQARLTDEEIATIEPVRDRRPAKPVSFE